MWLQTDGFSVPIVKREHFRPTPHLTAASHHYRICTSSARDFEMHLVCSVALALGSKHESGEPPRRRHGTAFALTSCIHMHTRLRTGNYMRWLDTSGANRALAGIVSSSPSLPTQCVWDACIPARIPTSRAEYTRPMIGYRNQRPC
jgi:hypothetical protein